MYKQLTGNWQWTVTAAYLPQNLLNEKLYTRFSFLKSGAWVEAPDFDGKPRKLKENGNAQQSSKKGAGFSHICFEIKSFKMFKIGMNSFDQKASFLFERFFLLL